MTFFDAHVLFGQDEWLSRNKPALSHTLDLNGLRDTMDNISGEHDWLAAIMPFPSARNPSYALENEWILTAAEKEQRVIPVVAANPNDAFNRSALEEMAKAGCIAGLMIWPILCNLDLFALADDNEFWSFVAQYDLPVTIHVATGDEPVYRPDILENGYGPLGAVHIARSWPQIRFNLSHALRLSRTALEKAAGLPNVWTDLSGYSAYGRWLEGGSETFPASDAILGPDRYLELYTVLCRSYGFTDRVLFASSEPFCRWWAYTSVEEFAKQSQIHKNGIYLKSTAQSAITFFQNWKKPAKWTK